MSADGIVWDGDTSPASAAPTLRRPGAAAAAPVASGIQWDSESTAPPAAPTLQNPQSRSLLRTAGDIGVSLGQGVESAGMFVPQLANTLTGGAVDKYAFKPVTGAVDSLLGGPGEGRTLAEASQDTRTALNTLKSPYLQQKDQELADTKGFLPTAKKILTTPSLLVEQAAEQVPQLVAPGGVVRKAGAVAFERAAGSALARGVEKRVAAGMTEEAATKAASAAAERLGQRAAIKAGTKAAIGTEAAMSGSQNSEQAQQQVMGLDQKVLDANPDYQAMVARGVTPQDAREALAQQAGIRAGAAGAAITALTGGLTGKLESKIFQGETGVEGLGKLLTGTGAKELAKAVGKETVQEGLQEGGEQFGQNLGVQSVDPNQSLMDQVPENAALGAVLGGTIGGTTFAGSAALSRPHHAGVPNPDAAPGTLSDAANVLATPPGPLGRVAEAAQVGGMRPNDAAAQAAGAPPLPGESTPAPATETAQPATAATPEPAPTPAPAPNSVPLPWVNPQTGEVGTPTKGQLTIALADYIAQTYQAAGHMRINAGDVADAWGVPKAEINRVRNGATQLATRKIKAGGAVPTETGNPVSEQDQPVGDTAQTDTTASIPFMLTNGMKAELRALGHTDADISAMTPEQAHATLRAGESVLGGARELLGHTGPAADTAIDQAAAESQAATETTPAAAKEPADGATGTNEESAIQQPAVAGEAASGNEAGQGAPGGNVARKGTTQEAAAPRARKPAAAAVESAPAVDETSASLVESENQRRAAEPYLMRRVKAGDSFREEPFKSQHAVQVAINRIGADPDHYKVEPLNGGFIGTRKSEVALEAEKIAPRLNAAVGIETPHKVSAAARDAEGLRINTPDGETNGRSHVDGLIRDGFTKVESHNNGKTMQHTLVNAAGERAPIKARQLKYAQEASARHVETTRQQIDAAAHEAATSPHNDTPEPTQPQIEAGNYKKGHIDVHGLDISIENPRGSTRSGVGENGKPWSHVMSDHYGYVRGTVGADGDHVDTYVGQHPESKRAYVIDQIDQKTGAFDEHKVMLGFRTKGDAVRAYKSNFDPGWKVGPVKDMTVDQFKAWLKDGDTTSPLAGSVPVVNPSLTTAQADRRTDTAHREAIDALPPEQSEVEKLRARVADLERAQHTSDVTGLRNKSAFDADAALGWPAVGAADMDGLKSLNDTIGHEAADTVLKALGDHLKSLEGDGVRFYHRSGDEFAARFQDASAGEQIMRDVQQALEGVKVELSDGTKQLVYDGIGLSVGHGDTYEAADAAVNRDKADRLASGKREQPRADGAPRRLRDVTDGIQADAGDAERGQAVSETGDRAGQPEGLSEAPPARARAVAEEKPAQPTKSGNTKDAGAELWANRRNSSGKGLGWHDIADLNDTLKAREAVKAKVWPRPNYGELVEGGMPAPIAHVIKQVYDAISVKPQARVPTDQHYQDYIAAVQKVRDAAFAWAKQVMEKTASTDEATSAGVSAIASRNEIDPAHAAAMMSALRIASGRNYPILEAVFPMPASEGGSVPSRFRTGEHGKANNALANLLGGNKIVSAMQVGERSLRDATKAIEKGWPAAQEAWEKTYTINESKAGESVRGDGGTVTRSESSFYVTRKSGNGMRRIVAEGFKTREEAVDAAKAAYARQRQSGGDGAKAEAPVELRDARTGPARRAANEDVTSDHLRETFGFKGINFGNWMKGDGAKNAAERQAHLNHAYDAFHDLAEIMGLPAKAMSLNGTLGLAIGAQGNGGKKAAAAHFVPGVNEINLTREQGAGSLAHEWAHALDHYFAAQAGGRVVASKTPFLTEHLTNPGDGVRAEVRRAFKAIVEAMETRPETEQEQADRLSAYQKRGRDGVESVLRTARESIEKNGKGDTAAALEQFDAMAQRLRVGDIGEGYVKTGKGQMDAAPQMVGQVANLVKETTGRKADWIDALSSYARMVSGVAAAKSDNAARAARVTSDYAKEAGKLEGGRKQRYWSTKLEMFARAFQSYVLDKLAAEGNRNSYLTRSQMDPSTLKAAQDMGTGEAGDRYPRGEERAAIDKAFDALVGELKTRDDESGNVALFSIDTAGKPIDGRIATSLADARKAAGDFIGKPIENENGLVPATVSGVTLGKMLSKSAVEKSTSLADHVRAVANVDALYRIGMLDESGPDARGEPTIAAIHRVVAPMVGANGDVLAVKMTVKETTGANSPNPLYTVETLDVTKPALLAPQGGIEPIPGRNRNIGQAGFSADVTRMLEEFKRKLPLFRQTSEPVTSTEQATPEQEAHTAKIKQIATAAMGKWKGDDVPALRVVATPEQLPEMAKRDANGLPSDAYKTAKGMYDGRTIYIVASRHATDQAGTRSILSTLAHEGIGHYGVERIVTRELGAEAWAKIESAAERLRADPKLASPAIREVLASVERRYQGADAPTFAREFLAVSAERGVRNGLLDRVVTAIRQWLRKVLPNLKLSEHELRQLLVQSDQYLSRGESYQQRVQAVAAMSFSKDGRPAAEGVAATADAEGTGPTSIRSAGRGATVSHVDAQFNSPAFKRWFGDSKVVDAAGAPLPVYHGTADDFEAFDPKRSGSATAHMTANLGTFFAEDRAKAQHYAENASQGVPAEERVVDAYLSIQKPYEMGLPQFMDLDSQEESEALRNKLIGQGYDGIHIKGANQWIAFTPTQIKSASENRGTFDPGNPNIYFSRDENADPDNPKPARRSFTDAAASIEAIHDTLPQLDRSAFQQVKDWISGKARDLEPLALGALQLRHVLELASEDPTLKAPAQLYANTYQRMDGDRNTLTIDGAAKVDALVKWARQPGLAGWMGKVSEDAKRLFHFMHAVTQLAVDPTNQYERLLMRDAGNEYKPWTKELIKQRVRILREVALTRSGDDKTRIYDEIKDLQRLPQREKVREQKYPELVRQWNALTPEAKKQFQVMRDHYREQSEALEEATLAHIASLDIPEQNRRAAAALVNRNFAEAKVDGVYFPLSRFGDYWISATTKDGEYVFAKYESANQMQQAEKRFLASGAHIEARGRQDNNYKAKDAPSGTFIGDLMGVLKNAPDTVKDEIYQMYLKALPNLSLRKHGIHRKNIAGYTDDVPRAFAGSVFHGAHQISKARYGWQLTNTLEQMRERMESRRTVVSGTEAAHADALIGEINRRHDWILNPTNNALSNKLTGVAFTYFLGASPASAIVNLIQVPQIVLPVLGAQHGWGRATAVLGRAMKQAIGTGGHIDKVLTGQELDAYRALEKQGTFQRSATHALAGISEGDNLRSSPAYTKVMNAVSWMFHTSEVINREATGMAAFRLAREKGQKFEEALRYADQITNGTHGDYSNANRARYMQGNVQKVVLQFKNYSLAMSWLWGRNFYNAFKGEDAATRTLARRTLTGMLGMTGLFAGVVGMPIFNLLRYGAQAVHAASGDDDEPWDFVTEFRSWLAEHLGETAASVIADGAASQLGANVASRVSMSDLWFRDADKQLEGEDAYNNMLQSIAGPLGGLIKNMYVGAQQFSDGHTERGIETMLPTFAKNAVKAARFASQGVNTLRGDPIVSDVSAPQAVIQALGFQPTKVADQQRLNNALYNYQKFIQDRRQQLMNAFAMAQQAGDDDGRAATLAKIQSFNQKYPEIAIRMSNLHASLRQRARFSAEADNGIRLNKKLEGRVREEVGAQAAE